MTRVAHVLGPLRPSGMERMLVSGAPHFRDIGIENLVIGLGSDHPFAPSLRAVGNEVLEIPAFGSGGARQLVAALMRYRPDVVHLHTEGNYLGMVAACRLGASRAPIVRTIHNAFAATGRWRKRRLMQARLADPLVFQLVVPSSDVAAIESEQGRATRTILNWVDDRFFGVRRPPQVDISSRKPIAVLVGNCSEIKRHELALHAALDAGYRVAHLGDETGASEAEVDLLNKIDARGRLIHRGVRDPIDALREADVFMMPSVREGMPVSLAEALVSGLPALISDSPGLRWAKSIPGVQVLPDEVASWSDALVARPMPCPAQQVIDFSARRGVREYGALYESAIRSRSRRG